MNINFNPFRLLELDAPPTVCPDLDNLKLAYNGVLAIVHMCPTAIHANKRAFLAKYHRYHNRIESSLRLVKKVLT